MKTKQCSKCKEVKAVDEFSRNKSTRDGLSYECLECMREYQRKYREENREAERERHRKKREENREAVLEYQRKYREENREVILERSRRYKEENREVILERSRRYGKENREVTRAMATKSGRYTLEEDLIVLDDTLTIYQKAVKLGRTYSSVNGRAQKLRQKASQNA